MVSLKVPPSRHVPDSVQLIEPVDNAIILTERLHHAGEDRIGLLFVVGEENGSDGAWAAEHLEPRGRFLVNGEPTENKLSLGQKGTLKVVLESAGVAAHSGYPEPPSLGYLLRRPVNPLGVAVPRLTREKDQSSVAASKIQNARIAIRRKVIANHALQVRSA